jgi:hypothetical protein
MRLKKKQKKEEIRKAYDTTTESVNPTYDPNIEYILVTAKVKKVGKRI